MSKAILRISSQTQIPESLAVIVRAKALDSVYQLGYGELFEYVWHNIRHDLVGILHPKENTMCVMYTVPN